jgi:hypothetical protein
MEFVIPTNRNAEEGGNCYKLSNPRLKNHITVPSRFGVPIRRDDRAKLVKI